MRALVLLVVVFGPMVIEAQRASRNERALRRRGGIEPAHDVYGAMKIAYPGAFALMLAETVLRPPVDDVRLVGAGLALFALGKALKWWAIVSLGPSWTFRVIVVPGASLVTSGPYRFLRHPNYVGVVGELAGIGLAAGAAIAGPVMVVVFSALMWRRIGVEEQALRAVSSSSGPS